MPAPEPDYYTLLSVTRTATLVEIRTAYRRLAREHHPDANPGPAAETLMRRINEAWETLRDPDRRSQYDRRLPRPVTQRPLRRQPPPQRSAPQRASAAWFATEDAPREPARPSAEFIGDITVNWYSEIGVREDAPRHEIVKALSRMAESLNAADISATEFARRRRVMKEAWAVLGDQYLRAAYDRARRRNPAPAAREAHEKEPHFGATNPKPPPPPPGHRLGAVTIDGFIVEKGAVLAGRDLRGADLRGLDLSGINLSGARLQGADFESASLRRANLTGADLSGANLRYADLSHADASGATLRQADLHGAALAATKFFRANLSGASLTDAVGPGVNLDYADLARTDFTGAQITPQLIERGHLDGTLMPDGRKSLEPQ